MALIYLGGGGPKLPIIHPRAMTITTPLGPCSPYPATAWQHAGDTMQTMIWHILATNSIQSNTLYSSL